MVCARMIYIYIYTAFTQYPNRYLYPTFSESDSYRIRYSLFVSVTESVRIRICIRTLSVSESEQKYENKYNMSDIRSYPIRFHPYLELLLVSAEEPPTFALAERDANW